MTCRDFVEFIIDYLSGGLSTDVLKTFERHLSLCPACQKYLAAYRESLELGRRAFDDEGKVPESVPDDLVEAILTARAKA